MKKLMKNKKGFTIVELVIVIAVIGILAGVLIPTFSGIVNKANESGSLQKATSAMKTVLAQSSSATLANGTYFVIGNTDGVKYMYKYDNNKMGTENLAKEKTNATGNKLSDKKVTDTNKALNSIIVPLEGGQPSYSTTIKALIAEILGVTITDLPDSYGVSTVEGAAQNAIKTITVNDNGENKSYNIFANVDFAEDIIAFTYSD